MLGFSLEHLAKRRRPVIYIPVPCGRRNRVVAIRKVRGSESGKARYAKPRQDPTHNDSTGRRDGRFGGAMIIEMRTYKLKPGKRLAFLEIFRTKSMPAHAAIGMQVLGPFLSIEDPDTFFFMRGFPDLASRDPMKAQFYEGELWKREL